MRAALPEGNGQPGAEPGAGGEGRSGEEPGRQDAHHPCGISNRIDGPSERRRPAEAGLREAELVAPRVDNS
jgi:hypothetical protein